jgi:hypothetical protein
MHPRVRFDGSIARSAFAQSPPNSRDGQAYQKVDIQYPPERRAMLKSTNDWRERLAKMPPERQAIVKAAIKQTILLRQEAAKREAAEFILKLQRNSRRRLPS